MNTPDQRARSLRLMRFAVPILVLVMVVVVWDVYVRVAQIPHYILPGPELVVQTLWADWGILLPALLVTAKITFLALGLALVGGLVLAVVVVQSRWVELAVFPLAVVLQVTPIIAIAPLIIIYAPSHQSALFMCAFIVAFFPILANMVQGLKSVNHNLEDMFTLYKASRWQRFVFLQLPGAQPYIMTGLRIGGGLALIAAVVAEFAAGSAGAESGLAFRLLEAQYRLNIPRLFAALLLLALLGVMIFAVTSAISWLVLHRWHESQMQRES